MHFARCFVSVFLIAFIVSLVDSADVDCRTGNYLAVLCKLSGVTASTSVKRIYAEVYGRSCAEGFAYSYQYYGEGTGYIVAFYGCGGRFRVNADTTPTWKSWSAWSACSVDCGSGSRSRTRNCSTGVKSDCDTGNNGDNQSSSCNYGSCDKLSGSLNSVCSKPELQYRILGGQAANECEYPWMVMFYNKRVNSFCGGTIIDKNHIMTAAHCVKSSYHTARPSDIVVVSGANLKPSLSQAVYGTNFNRQHPHMTFRYVSEIKVHPYFDPQYLTNDIAVMTLTDHIQFDKCHVPICLPSVTPTNLSGCKVMGWGTTSNGRYASISPQLLYAEVNVVSPSRCLRTFRSWYFNEERQLCVGGDGRGSCKGDSGGPLICPGVDGRYYQYGIVSGGAQNRCGTEVSFYTKVTNYQAWITANTAY